MNEIFNRARLLLGDDHMERLAAMRVIIFGAGGVGSWCAEALVRTGVGHLTVVDNDVVSITNVNRQMMATMQTVGQVKVEALRERLLAINPEADIVARREVFCAATAVDFGLEDFDVIVDCIDSLTDKALLIETATRMPGRLFSSMGAALKTDPTQVRVAEFWKVRGCPLARALRQRFKRRGFYPARKFQCVYSEEQGRNVAANIAADEGGLAAYGSTRKAAVNGSLMTVTATFGLTLASLILAPR